MRQRKEKRGQRLRQWQSNVKSKGKAKAEEVVQCQSIGKAKAKESNGKVNKRQKKVIPEESRSRICR
jgi:hypothetical protein